MRCAPRRAPAGSQSSLGRGPAWRASCGGARAARAQKYVFGGGLCVRRRAQIFFEKFSLVARRVRCRHYFLSDFGARRLCVVRPGGPRDDSVRSGPPGRVRWRAGGACAKIFFGGLVHAPVRAGKIFF